MTRTAWMNLVLINEADVSPVIAAAGVRIERKASAGGETELQCRGKPSSRLGALDAVIPRDPDNPLNR